MSACGAEQPAGLRYCCLCGSALVRTCGACGSEVPANAAFCSACGAALSEGRGRGTAVVEHEERRVVTVLFADLAGSTARGSRIDPEELRVLQA